MDKTALCAGAVEVWVWASVHPEQSGHLKPEDRVASLPGWVSGRALERSFRQEGALTIQLYVSPSSVAIPAEGSVEPWQKSLAMSLGSRLLVELNMGPGKKHTLNLGC